MPTVSEDEWFITFTHEDAAAHAAAGTPESRYLDELINSYALGQGGEVLAVWECLQGPRRGKNIKWSPARIAAHLGISQARMDQMLDDTMAAVWPAWEASPHYGLSEAACQKAHPRSRSGSD
jgi:hypothetical protein